MIDNCLKQLRERKNVTQEQLATAVDVSRQTIIAIEKGNYEPSLSLAIKLTRFFSGKGEKLKIEDIFMLQ